MQDLKQRINKELNKKEFPDLKFLFSDEALEVSLEILEELLAEEKLKFEEIIKKDKKDLIFDTFQEESLLDYYWSLLNHYKNVNNNKKIRDIVEKFRPKLEDFGNYVAYNKEYYEALKYVNENFQLDKEQKRVLFLSLKAYKDRGIDLDESNQERLKKINKKLSKLSEKFENNIVDDQSEFEYFIEKKEDIKNLPEEILELTKKKAEEKNLDGFLFDADPTSYVSIMKYSDSRKIREDFEKARNSFACSGKYDNREIILEILKLKSEKSKILGYKNYAELSLNSKMADSPELIFGLIEGINKKAHSKAKIEIEDLKKYFNLEDIKSYDLSYYSRKLKEEKYRIDEKLLKEYFEYENVLNYLFNFVDNFFGLKLVEIKTQKYNDDVKSYEVYKDGKLISYYLLDVFYNKNKRPGAWADNLREKTYFGENKKIPVVINVCNFQKTNSKITLSMRDVETIFHEFGHAIHEILSESKYSDLSGFGVEWDFVELPSQILENWVKEKESLEKLAKHYETGEKLDSSIISKLEELKTFMSGNFVARQNEFALLDISLHSGPVPNTIEELDKIVFELVNKYSFFNREPDYKMYTSFGHIFGGGYAAGYYSYMWAEIIEADVFAKIKNDGMFDKEVGEYFIKTILGQGTRKKASELFFDFMGREVDNNAFMERKGF